MPDDRKLEEQALSQAVEMGISSQIESAESLNVQVRTDLLKAVQGTVDSVSVTGTGMVVQPDVRVESMELHTDRISINPISALLGQVNLDQPVNTVARMVFTEVDLNQTLNSDYVRDKLSAVSLTVEGESVPVEMQLPMAIDLQTPGKIGFSGTLLVHESAGVAPVAKREISFQAVLVPRTDEHSTLIESFECQPGQGMSLPFAIALLQKGQELLQSPYLELGGMAVRVKQLAVEPGTLILQGEAHIYQMPQM
jgi:hypothetical protein